MRRVFDIHTHLQPSQARRVIRILDDNGIETANNVNGGLGEMLDYALAMERGFPGRFTTFARPVLDEILLWKEEKMRGEIEKAVEKGARGIKVGKQLGLLARDGSGHLVRADDERLDPLWESAGALGVPVLIHVGDPKAFFDPVTSENERYEELQRSPDWSFADRNRFPAREELLIQQETLLARHPRTTFVCAHFGNNAEDIGYVRRLFEKYPNFHADIAARVAEIGRHDPRTVREVFTRFSDRIFFGTDLIVNDREIVLGSPDHRNPTEEDIRKFYNAHWRFLETNDRQIEHPSPIQGRWKVDAIGLDRETLEKIYHLNARRLLHK